MSDPTTAAWHNSGSTSVVPPSEYWTLVAANMPGPQVERLRELSDLRLNEFAPEDLPLPRATALVLLDRVAADGWLQRVERRRCPKCNYDLTTNEPSQVECPNCHVAYADHGGVISEIVFTRNLAIIRSVDWVVAIHGMNTAGSWQEVFSWRFSTTWGRSVPVAVYKYGIITAGVILPCRRRQLQDQLRSKLAALRDEARLRGFSGNPDIIAHSFGTWLLGHIILEELQRKPPEQLRFGRIILTGCVLRPDFDWATPRREGLVEDVLNHYGTRDNIVPLAHVTIWDSGPSGRRGFDGTQVLNVRADGSGHSDLLDISNLPDSYQSYWRPFLTLPRSEFNRIPNQSSPTAPWRPLPSSLAGVIFPFLALPLVFSVMAILLGLIGKYLSLLGKTFDQIAISMFVGLLLLTAVITLVSVWRRVMSRRGDEI
jgi:hypothetical protein